MCACVCVISMEKVVAGKLSVVLWVREKAKEQTHRPGSQLEKDSVTTCHSWTVTPKWPPPPALTTIKNKS